MKGEVENNSKGVMNRGVFVCRVSLKDKDVASINSKGQICWDVRSGEGSGHL